MKLLQDDIAHSMYWDAMKQTIHLVWKWPSRYMNTTEFKTIQLQMASQINTLVARTAFIDCTDLGYVITPDIQEWMAESLFIRINKKALVRIGMLKSPCMASDLLLGTLAESTGEMFDVHYFNCYEEAKAWLNAIQDVQKKSLKMN